MTNASFCSTVTGEASRSSSESLGSSGGLLAARTDPDYDRPMPERLYFTDSDEANALIATDPMALLVGFALDQQITVQHAFSGPLTLQQRLGSIDAATLAALRASGVDGSARTGKHPVSTPPASGLRLERRSGRLPVHAFLMAAVVRHPASRGGGFAGAAHRARIAQARFRHEAAPMPAGG